MLAGADGRTYGVDHGICLHQETKLRTVLWGWVGDPLVPDEVDGVERVRSGLDGALGDRLSELLAAAEVDAVAARCEQLLAEGRFPAPEGVMSPVPWPLF